ncbi:MAG: glycosyltransferase [Pedobacter sp.]|nr:MAG: glycosyltransferase [Pedobacter sp.]
MINQSVRIFVITFQRPHLLKRALSSIISQTHSLWVVEVINDDPKDTSVKNLIDSLGDPRIRITSDVKKRGGTGNFNYAFDHKINEKYACILEDDNWYEPAFLEEMLHYMKVNPTIRLAVANEKIWYEESNGCWTYSNNTIWPVTEENELFEFIAEEKCGDAKICNSSMFWKTEDSLWLTPVNIPIDVTEHFRERAIPHPILLITKPLVNFSVTLETYRKKNNDWSVYQAILIASVFENIEKNEKIELAQALWKKARQTNKLYSTSLMSASLVCSSSSILFNFSSFKEKLRFFLTILKRPFLFYNCIRAKKNKKEAWDFLLSNWNTTNNSSRSINIKKTTN